MRGRLINAYLVELAQLDAQLSAASNPGLDPIKREPRVAIDSVTHQRVTGRKERTVRLPAQLDPTQYGQLVVSPTGVLPKTGLTLTFHFNDLEDAGMVDDQRRTTPIRVGDRLVAVYRLEDEELLIAYPNPPGVFCTEARPGGLLGGGVNLLITTWGDRPQGRVMG